MNKIKPRILAIDDEEDILLLYKNVLKKDFDLTATTNGKEALSLIQVNNYDLIILDIIMPEMNGIEVLKKLKDLELNIDIIMVTASKDIKPAIDSMKLGALDYVIKPFEIDALLLTIKKALERRKMIRENTCLKLNLEQKNYFGELIGKSEVIRHIFSTIENISDSNSTVLITGESGTGKEVVASTIHKKSKRANMPYVVVNCAAIPENLLESEMFGHEKGSFTGALERHIGKFELASGGTIFLDEIGELPAKMQAKLLRVIQEGVVERVGGEKLIPIDIRIIAATNIDIASAIKAKKFREDLYYRLNVIPITLPPLRERLEDMELFIEYFISKFNKVLNKSINKITKDAVKILKGYKWPGNIRELENMIERIATLSKDTTIDIQHLPQEMKTPEISEYPALNEDCTLNAAIKNHEKRIITDALRRSGGNQTKAAKSLGIHRTTLISKKDALGIK
jgi:two-component system, NtrC family, response regulator AtoC